MRTPRSASQGSSRRRKPSTPGFCPPTAFSTPAGTGTTRGPAAPAPARGSTVRVVSVPNWSNGVNRANSRPNPAHPAAVDNGFGTVPPPNGAVRSTS
ncbi:hypothetical protein Kpho01_51850 [Kitasatospora phosalacinea]|uniref:Uncharacterized protein n=1 Tax=Kitasatospora phosalacinea TaxID=2065 RepID=A0A9W6PJ46_9ACTN|nr:hypothetical protein Kpho01_51850 [Kitasatospora phosalacinea]